MRDNEPPTPPTTGMPIKSSRATSTLASERQQSVDWTRATRSLSTTINQTSRNNTDSLATMDHLPVRQSSLDESTGSHPSERVSAKRCLSSGQVISASSFQTDLDNPTPHSAKLNSLSFRSQASGSIAFQLLEDDSISLILRQAIRSGSYLSDTSHASEATARQQDHMATRNHSSDLGAQCALSHSGSLSDSRPAAAAYDKCDVQLTLPPFDCTQESLIHHHSTSQAGTLSSTGHQRTRNVHYYWDKLCDYSCRLTR